MFVSIPKQRMPAHPSPPLDLGLFEVGRINFKGGIPDTILVDELTAFALGLFLGDGYANARAGTAFWHLSEGYKEKYVAPLLLWASKLGCNFNAKQSGKNITVRLYSTKLATFLRRHFYRDIGGRFIKGASKQLPDFVWNWNARAISYFLFGWHESDGNHDQDLTQPRGIATASRAAWVRGAALFIKLGVMPTLRKQRSPVIGRQDEYSLHIPNHQIKKLGWPLATHDKKDRKIWQEDAGHFYIPLTKLTRFEYEGPVYDWTTPSASYQAPFTVHNSTEKAEGRGFIGPSGQALWQLAAQVGLSREFIWVTNASLCQARKVTLANGAVIPSHIVKAMAAKACRLRLIREINYVNPVVVVPLGNWALWSLSDIPKAKIYGYRGSIIPKNLYELEELIQRGLTKAPIQQIRG
jgi:hypothetical protein